MPRFSTVLCPVLFGSLACATAGDSLSGQTAPVEPGDAQSQPKATEAGQTLSELERRLQDAAEVEIAFVIESDGAYVSHLEGTLAWTRDASFALKATGEFAGEAQDLELRGDASMLEVLVAGESRGSGPRPPALVEAVVLGLTRQGLLHNLAVLSAGGPPEHGDGGIAEWIELRGLELGPIEQFGTQPAEPLDFRIWVEGAEVGRATLWLDARQLPLERRQTVDFPDGQMRVIERYTSFEVR